MSALTDAITSLWCFIGRNSNTFIAFFTIGLFFVTFALARYTKRLWRATNDLVSRSEEMSKRQLRAYMGQARTEAQPGHHRIVVHVRNEGETPAHNVVIRGFATAAEPVEITSDLFTYEANPQLLQRQQGFQVLIPTDAVVEAAIGLNHRYFIYCEIDYTDSFRHQWTTIFCMEWDPISRSWGPYQRHNEERDRGEAN